MLDIQQKKEWTGILFALGFSHKVKFEIPSSIEFDVEQDQKGNYVVTLRSINKQYLWEVAAKIRDLETWTIQGKVLDTLMK